MIRHALRGFVTLFLYAPIAAATPVGGITVMPGAFLKALSGDPITNIAAYAAGGEGGALSPIPFQIDERDPDGRYVVDKTVDGSLSDLPRDDGRFDSNDEAVFDAGDAGRRIAASEWPSHSAGMEVEIEFPATKEKRYVYILSVTAPPASPRDDVRYDPSGSGSVDARHYSIGFGKTALTVDSLKVKPVAGGTDVNLVKKSKYKSYARLTPYLLSLRINRDDDDLVTKVLGYREGPVRLIRLVQRHTKLVLGLATPQHVQTEFYSGFQAERHEEVGYTLDMKRLVARSVVEHKFEFSDETTESNFLCDGGGSEILDGKKSGSSLDLQNGRWWGVAGPSGSFYVRYAFDGEGDQKLLFKDKKKGMGGWQVDVISMNGRIHPLVTRLVFPAADIAADPERVPWIEAPDPVLSARTAREIAGGTGETLGPSGPPASKTLKRRYDVITLTGYNLKAFLGVPIEKLRLYGASEGRLSPVVFQVDEKDGQGRYVVPDGEAGTRDVDGAHLDDNDEIVTMANRVGDRVAREAWPDGITHGSEFEVRDPAKSEKGWLYLFAFAKPPPSTGEKLVRREGFDKILSDAFTVGFPEEMVYFDHFTMKTTESEEFSDNLVDRLKIRFRLTFSFLFIPLPYRAGEDDFERRTIAYKEGPVRIIFRQDVLIKLTFGVIFHIEPSDWLFYENQAVSYVRVKNPFLYEKGALKRTKNAHFIQTVDMDRKAAGMRFYNSENQGGVEIDGEMSKVEKDLAKQKDSWAILTGEQAHTVVRIRFLEGMDPDRDLTYVDDKNKKDWNDRDYGQWGNAGYDIDLKAEGSVILLTAPVYTIVLYFYQPPDFGFERRDEILQILDTPLETREVRSGGPQPSTAGTARARAGAIDS